MKKIDKTIICQSCHKSFDGGRAYKTKKTCSKECNYNYLYSKEKTEQRLENMKKTNIQKYGTEFFQQTPEYRDKFIKTMNNKSDEDMEQYKKKISNGLKKKYKQDGDKILSKRKKTLKERYGDETYVNLEKMKDTVKKKYGVEYVTQSDEFKQSRESTWIKKYGKQHPYLNNVGGIESCKKKLLNEYGVEYYFQSEDSKNKRELFYKNKLVDIIHENNIELIDFNFIGVYQKNKLRTPIRYKCKCKECKFEYEIDFRIQSNKMCPKCYPNGSGIEKQLQKFLIDNNIDYIKNDRIIIKPLELDFYLPDYRIGIELNGNYWHGELSSKKNQEYHQMKSLFSERSNVNLIQIYEDQFVNSKSTFFLYFKKIFKLIPLKKIEESFEVLELGDTIYKILSEKYCMNGYGKSYIRLGILDKKTNEIISFLSFKRNGDKDSYSISRFSDVGENNYINSFNILFTYFLEKFKPSKVSYWQDCNLYGLTTPCIWGVRFKFVRYEKQYWYVDRKNYFYRISNLNFTKNKLIKLLKLDKGDCKYISEWELAQKYNLDRISGVGYNVFEYILNK